MKPARIVPPDTVARQALAADPALSAWVSANAGSGKTHVLAQRVVRLLLGGADPARILCLTYTRAAAANMSNRVFRDLARWATLPDEKLAAEIEVLEGRRPGRATLRAARKLFARALETPGGLKIQTIHAFCEAILRQFPLEANVAAHFELLDPGMEEALVAAARRDMLTGAGGGDPRLSEAFAAVLAQGGEAGLDALLGEIVRKRDALRLFIDQTFDPAAPFAPLFEAFGFSPADDAAGLAGAGWPDAYFSPGLAHAFSARAASAGKQLAQAFAAGFLVACREADPVKRLDCLRDAFLTRKGGAWQPRVAKSIAAKGVGEHFPGFADEFGRMASAVRSACDRLALWRMLDGTRAALTIADWLIRRYEQLKHGRGFLDFNDLIQRTVRLLGRTDVGPWVQYKLDRGIDHILLDEAQDTSPDQWSVVTRLAEEFFAGAGARDEARRTVFAVGDEKQSIYSFQGAVPASFADTGRALAARIDAAGRRYERVRLPWSFRSTVDVLSAVDLVFADESVRRGLTRDDEPIVHRAIRGEEPGHVEIWPSLGATAVEEPDDWTQSIDHAAAPAVRVAENVAATIAGWIRSGEALEATGRPIRPGDVMVLVRKRDRFVHALTRALKNREVAVAGADRLSLPGHIAVKDLAALGRFLVQPEDDLSLAAVLRSPIFALSEERLFDLAAGRPAAESLAASLRRQAKDDPALEEVVRQLDGWANEAAFRPVFEFYAALLGRDGLRKKMIARLGHEAGDILDEFLNFCLAEERTGLPGIEAFLSTLDSAGPEVKREMDQRRNEVRILTVHAAKGLEAPVVFLVDGGSAPFSDQHMPRLMPFDPPGRAWNGKGFLWRAASDVANDESRGLAAAEKERADDEYRRLLYVGMTRAEDRLVICGYHGRRDQNASTWHAIVTRALCASENCAEVVNPHTGENIFRYRVTGPAAADAEAAAAPAAAAAEPVPAALREKLAPDEELPQPLSPSRASVLIEAGAEPPVATGSPVLDPQQEPGFAIRRGLATHRLLQMLPGMPAGERAAAAVRYLEHAGAGWSPDQRRGAADAVFAVLDDPAFAPLFAEGSRAEVSIAGNLVIGGRKRAVAGKIDRIAVTPERALIVDYKTDRPAPRRLDEVPPAYVAQLALYRALLAPLYPDRPVEAALLFTGAPALAPVPGAALDRALARLGLA